MKRLFIMAYQSTQASENAGMPGDNALFSCARELRARGYTISGTEVAVLPSGDTIPLNRQKTAIAKAESCVVLVFGRDTVMAMKQWFPHTDMIVVPHQFSFMSEPGRIDCELVRKIEDFFDEKCTIYGFNPKHKEIGYGL